MASRTHNPFDEDETVRFVLIRFESNLDCHALRSGACCRSHRVATTRGYALWPLQHPCATWVTHHVPFLCPFTGCICVADESERFIGQLASPRCLPLPPSVHHLHLLGLGAAGLGADHVGHKLGRLSLQFFHVTAVSRPQVPGRLLPWPAPDAESLCHGHGWPPPFFALCPQVGLAFSASLGNSATSHCAGTMRPPPPPLITI